MLPLLCQYWALESAPQSHQSPLDWQSLPSPSSETAPSAVPHNHSSSWSHIYVVPAHDVPTSNPTKSLRARDCDAQELSRLDVEATIPQLSIPPQILLRASPADSVSSPPTLEWHKSLARFYSD